MIASYNLADLRRLENRLSEPIDTERELHEASRKRFITTTALGKRIVIPVARDPYRNLTSWPNPSAMLYVSSKPGTAKNTFTTEAQINDTAGMGPVAELQPYYYDPSYGAKKVLRVILRGILSSTVTPTYTFFVRFGTSSAGVLVAGTAALTTTSGAANQPWEAEFDVVMETLGAAGANSTVRSLGLLSSPGLNPAVAGIFANAVQPGTIATVDISIANLFWIAAACSASSASNSITLLQAIIMAGN